MGEIKHQIYLQAESEVLRLQQLKTSKIKEVILKKRLDLEELCRKAHMVAEAYGAMDYSVEAIESGKKSCKKLIIFVRG